MIVQRQAVVLIPPEMDLGPRHCTAPLSDEFMADLTATVVQGMVMEIGHHGVSPLTALWIITCDPGDIDLLPYATDCSTSGSCASCREGRDLAKSYLRDNPGEHIAVGLVSFMITPNSQN